jgi:uncharacterized protein YcnI
MFIAKFGKLAMYQKISSALIMLAVFTIPTIASAHVIVTPSQAGIGQELVFNISSPNEQQTAIASLKLDIPKGVTEVVPTEKDGWTITTTSTGTGDDAEISSITWSGGQIPVGQREDFGFGAQVPAGATSLDWKAYQTYADGTVVHWDQKPAGSDDATGNAGPYSITKVVNDLTTQPTVTGSKTNDTLPLVLSLLALVISVAGIALRKK